MTLAVAMNAVVQVGGGGRGFIVRAGIDRFVVTAAHCVPREGIPTPHLSNDASDLTFENIIGPLGGEPTIWGELCVYGLTDDIAAFCEPAVGDLEDEYAQYVAFTDAAALVIGDRPDVGTETAAFVLSLDGAWQRCIAHNDGRFLHISSPDRIIETGMSGSPIVDESGAAIGLISTGNGPSLTACLPPWLLRRLDRA
ncbi:serine protease [Bradyrhizobium barranii subsp. apii]|uniref:Serine protease n=1 Tax=Bradyrhizobium barranii subsp. apii TaxID=2819348 RepID=A0A8T5V061_9BRAD|nr:trypsin-like peptidase domain-containing protein [Bradyrhizobium barranii]UPT87978.1 serine protease [Bradyrhizobium barranii subsp. apii]